MFYQINIFILATLAIIILAVLALVILIEDIVKKRLYQKERFELKRHHKNPILSPIHHNDWENEAVFNPAVFIDNENTVHILYRAIGSGGLSQIGYAKSPDGLYIEERYPYPVYQPPVYYEEKIDDSRPKEYNPSIYTSGGGWAGCEDPRIVCIDNIVYMIYLSFCNWNDVRMTLTSIPLSDLKKAKWNWKKPILISPKGEFHKNWVIFPEKINGKFAIIHSITPRILIDYFDHPNDLRYRKIESSGPKGGRENHWDNRVRGAGPPPIKTDEGWLLLYHAMDKNDPNKYKIGAMLLDLKDPTKILYRAHAPILSPDEYYENDGKPGVVYASGAFIKDDELFVYYGGADKVVCLAKTPVKKLLKFIKSGSEKSLLLTEV